MLTLFTIGHSNLSAGDFLARLKQHHITTLVDVRSDPVSRRFPHFNKDALESWLAEADITYRFAGNYLGGRSDSDPETTLQNGDFVMGIARLLNLTAQESGALAIMCAEGDPMQCHRHNLIARALLDPAARVLQGELDLAIQHILPDGSLVAAEFG
jgi:uncharacterized protein (DUF488 family)